MTSKINDTIVSLVKIAEQMIDNADAPKTASPEEVLNGLEAIIAQLEQVASSIPAESGQMQEQTQTPQEPTKPDGKMAELEKKIKDLSTQLESKDREEVASQYASLYTDSRVAQKKYEEVMKSNESVEVLRNKLNAIEEFAENNNVNIPRHAKSETFSYVRTAQQEKRLHTL